MRRIKNFIRRQRRIEALARVSVSLSRAAATAPLRRLDLTDPSTWEFSGFSQNGEDGILETLAAQLTSSNRLFLEVGASDGLENNCSWLAIGRRYGGVMVEGDGGRFRRGHALVGLLCPSVKFLNLYVSPSNVGRVLEHLPVVDPDVLSMDIDGIDFYVVSALLEHGLRPKIFVLEYNAGFGPELSVTVAYEEPFDRWSKHPLGIYYGASLQAWHRLLGAFGYCLVTVENNGINAFFVKKSCFQSEFLDGISGVDFRDNLPQRLQAGPWKSQIAALKAMDLVEVDDDTVGQLRPPG